MLVKIDDIQHESTPTVEPINISSGREGSYRWKVVAARTPKEKNKEKKNMVATSKGKKKIAITSHGSIKILRVRNSSSNASSMVK